MIGIIKKITGQHFIDYKLHFDNLTDIFGAKTFNLSKLMQLLCKFDIQAAIKCIQKIDQRQISSEPTRFNIWFEMSAYLDAGAW